MLKKIFYGVSIGIVLSVLACSKSTNPTEKKTKTKGNNSTPVVIPKVVHEAHLSSDWYNQVPTQLNLELDDYFKRVQENFYVEADFAKVKALVVPHAGYYHAGLCAASAYQTLFKTKNLNSPERKNPIIKRVIVLAPSHSLFFNGIALPNFTTYKTIYGDLEIDQNAIKTLSKHTFFRVMQEAFAPEHSLETQLPFLQKTIEQFSLIPLIVGHLKDAQTINEIADELKKVIDDTTLVVVSSDFLHHGDRFEYTMFKNHIMNQVRMLDGLAVDALGKKSLSAFEQFLEETGATICGKEPLKLLLRLIELGYLGDVDARLSCYYTSAHLAQARTGAQGINVAALMQQVPDEKARESVSYVGMVFAQQKLVDLKLENRLTGFEKKELLATARDTIAFAMHDKDKKSAESYPAPLLSPGIQLPYGAFVTLKKADGGLRGCIGQTYAYKPLFQTVMAMAKAAAFTDTRFEPLKPQELGSVVVDISILSQPRRITDPKDIQVGIHGVILNKFREDGSMASAVFLPQVAREHNWNLTMMLDQLALKAGLDQHAWQQGAEFYVFDGYEFSENSSKK